MAATRGKAAVVGLGAYGLVTLKNLREEGFDAVGFERNAYVGGLWKFTTDPTKTSVLKSTLANISKQRNSYTDFPYPDESADYPTGEQVQQYLENYTDHFQLRPHIKLSTGVSNITRSADDKQWIITSVNVDTNETTIEAFEKVVVCSGAFQIPLMPEISGKEIFEGKILHSREFKDPEEFKGKNVVVIGLSNTGADIIVDLCKVANKIYASHINGACVILRNNPKGFPADHQATYQLLGMAKTLEKYSPALKNMLLTNAMEKTMKQTFKNIDPQWRLLPAPPPFHRMPLINDHLIDLLSEGKVKSLSGIKQVNSAKSITFDDGTTIDDVDAIICATGYTPDFSFMAPEIDPTKTPTPEYDAAPYGTSHKPYIRLYQAILSDKYPSSLAFNGPFLIISAFTGADVVSQAIAQVFTGAYKLPPKSEIDRWCNEHYKWAVEQATIGRMTLGLVKNFQTEKWLNEVCGNQLDEKLGWGLAGWKFWFKDHEFRKMIVSGVNTGFIYRLFDGRRKAWPGAREAIYKANGKEWKDPAATKAQS